VNQAGRKNVDVAIPEAGGDNEACAVDDLGAPRDFDIRTRSNRDNATFVDQDGAVFDRWIGWGRIYLGANQRKIRSATRETPEERKNQDSS
jgi:hypothetical protein